MKYQRPGLITRTAEPADQSYIDDMVARIMPGRDITIKNRDRIGNNRAACLPDFVRHPVQIGFTLFRKPVGQILMV